MHVQVPIDDFFITWVIIGTFSAWGGLVRYIVDQNNEYEEWSWVGVLCQVIVSAFTGLIGSLFTLETGSSRYITFAIAGLFGAMGNTALKHLWQRFFSHNK
ncbi:putative phage-like protein [Yersinia pseudotuberculosis]|uniref:phage holin family protein n=1 Tax=Yersinia pseudotuberculosis TaxID=633 RepID=UPI000F6CCB07|nr:phage holin family protein [Yersinia pseudotuberculosis]VEB10501.1 putative phage-like protein [Yersinia pseudotuberculosis]